MAQPLPDDAVQRIRDAVFAGRKIEAIRLYRECTGEGLREAKDFVDALEEELRRAAPEEFTAARAGKGCAGVLLVLLLAVGVLAWIMA
jgi:hypothetical protein